MRVVVLGGGYAGLTLARKLERLRDEIELLLVDETGTHLVQHELHRVIRFPSIADQLRIPLASALETTNVREATVTSIDREDQCILLEDGSILYDVCAICLGANPAFYGLPGVESNAIPLKQLQHAHAIRDEFLSMPAGGRAVVGGAGLSGVQVAGELASLAQTANLDASVTLIEQEPTVAPGFPAQFRRAIEDALIAEGIGIKTGRTIDGVNDSEVICSSGTIEFDTFIWTGGICGPDPLSGKRPIVNSTLALDDRTFVLGDAARMMDDRGQSVPASAQSAVKAANVVAKSIARMVDSEERLFDPRMERFTFESRGWVVSIGDRTVATVGGTVLTGKPARVLKASIGARHLAGVGAVQNALEMVRKEMEFDAV